MDKLNNYHINGNYQKSILIWCLSILSTLSYSQKRIITENYPDGQLKSEGKMYFFSNYDKRIPKKYEYFNGFRIKDGEWKYYYENGKIARIENYKVIKDFGQNDNPNGLWSYFNENGTKYKEEIYTDGKLTRFEREIYYDNRLIGKVEFLDGLADTILYEPISDSKNLVLNGDFDYYYFKPIQIRYDGQTKLDDWIPFWKTTGRQTPDYLSNNRIIETLDYNKLLVNSKPDKFNYAGLALYKNGTDYSEYIQGELVQNLIAGHNYCIRIKISATGFSGYQVNNIGVFFTEKRGYVHFGSEKKYNPQIRFNQLPVPNDDFVAICDAFKAAGYEKIITVGSFIPYSDQVVTQVINPIPNKFGLNESGYYLIDKIEVFEISSKDECNCNRINIPINAIQVSEKTDTINSLTDFNDISLGKVIVLKNLNFDFDSYSLNEDSYPTLINLFDYLNSNPTISIKIQGHTDDIGTDNYNLNLSEKRAQSVYLWLINKGIKEDRLSFEGFGKQKPLIVPLNELDRAINRRVEIKIIEINNP